MSAKDINLFIIFFSEISNFVAGNNEMKRRVNRIFNSLDIFKNTNVC